MTEYIFPEIDKSYWLTSDKEWKSKRKDVWARIEPMLKSTKTSRGKTAIKQYFLTGKMPDWDKFRQWASYERHIDIFMFLWLHPSWDKEVLTPLREAYIASDLVQPDDIKIGFIVFLRCSIISACQDYTGFPAEEMKHVLVADGHNELLFKILIGDSSKKEYLLEPANTYPPYSVIFKLPESQLRSLNEMGRWLCIKEMHPINEDMLFQYDQPLEWWYESCTTDEDYFIKQAQETAHREFFRKALYRIHNFNTQKEGDTCRTRFVHKIRKILDEREFISEFKQMWEDTKAGKIEVKDPWQR